MFGFVRCVGWVVFFYGGREIIIRLVFAKVASYIDKMEMCTMFV